ncbi:MAG TPA: WYL domain-containing protein [Anaerolineaceae bacterium]|nr:WYL domain-containing protein [Anaerolineaceae bacterium]
MSNNPSQTKASRLNQIEALLLSHPEGLTQAEIARRLNVNRSTILRYMLDFPAPVYQDGQRYFIDREAYLINVRFSLHEALSVHLAARLLATRLDRQNPHAAAALRKLGLSLETLAPRISTHLQQSADVMDDASRHMDAVYLAALEKLTLAWAEQRKVRIWYKSDQTKEVKVYDFSVYFIEPYAVGQSTYAIGFSEPQNAMRTFKIERIQRVETLRDTYEIPGDFDPTHLLADAWGIWYTDKEPVEVVLKFGPRVAGRVGETQWHRSEQASELEDGSLLWRAWIAEPQEMMPWIRGWGGEVEVLAPESLRNLISEESRRLANMYKE